MNRESDFWSRKPDKHNWMLHPHTIDRFANCQNAQVPRFNSRYREPMSKAVDAPSQGNSHSQNNFVNAPFCLIHKVLDIILDQQAFASVTAPKWQGQIQNNRLVSLSTASPLRLPKYPYMQGNWGSRTMSQPEMVSVCLESVWRSELEQKG